MFRFTTDAKNATEVILKSTRATLAPEKSDFFLEDLDLRQIFLRPLPAIQQITLAERRKDCRDLDPTVSDSGDGCP